MEYINVVTEALDIQVDWHGSYRRATANNLPPGSPIGRHYYNDDLAKLELLCKIMSGTYRHKASKLIDKHLNRNKNGLKLNWNYEFLPEEKCKVIVTDNSGKEDSRVMRMVPEKNKK